MTLQLILAEPCEGFPLAVKVVSARPLTRSINLIIKWLEGKHSMGFSPEIKIWALVAAARHCCVCHKYKSVKVEVHHIVHQNQGGSDNFDNAIALCFDCHADAGHYNPKHPRGTRFSPKELRAQRDKWYEIVKENKIRSPEEEDLLYCRYLVCQNFEAFQEISHAEFKKIPFSNCLLVDNQVLSFHRKLVLLHSTEYRHSQEWGNSYSTREAYWEAHPNAKPLDRSEINYPYFEAQREIAESELQERVCLSDPITRLLLNANVPISEVAQALAYEEKCGDNCFQEIYRLRPLWAIYLAVTNVSDKQVTLKSIVGAHEPTSTISYRQFQQPEDSNIISLKLPCAPLLPNSTVIIPLATLLGSFEAFDFSKWSQIVGRVSDEQRQELVHTSFKKATSSINLIGPTIRPTEVQFYYGGFDRVQGVHELDLSNLYALNRYWEIGSCPHLFFKSSQTGKIVYFSELFSSKPSQTYTHVINVPDFADEALIAELEWEETYFEEIRMDVLTLIKNVHLQEGDILELKVRPGSMLYLKGYYVPKGVAITRALDPWRKNELVSSFLSRAT